MGFSAALMAVAGLILSFLPAETLAAAGVEPVPVLVVFAQVTGALYLGFAILNWTARGVIIGGIYARPLALGNFLHFGMVGMMLSREAFDHGVIQLAASAAVFSAFAIGFGAVLFRPPVPRQPDNNHS